MGGALTSSTRSDHHHESSSSNNSFNRTPICDDPTLIQSLKLIFRNEFAKSAFINFIRHEENSHEDGKDQNYFKKGNFAIIGSREEKVSEVLSNSRFEEEEEDEDEIPYLSCKLLFDDMDPETRKEVLSYKGGSSLSLLTAFQNANDEIILLMAIEALPRFQESDSYKRWWNREKSFEFSVTEFFSHHASSRRTATLSASTGQQIEALWSDRRDIFPAILHCLNKFPIASVILSPNTHHIVYASQPYAQFFGSTQADMVDKPLNLLHQNPRILQTFKDFQTAKFEMKCQKNHSSSDVTSIVVAIKPINDQNQNCIYFFIVIVDIQSQSFCLDTLKLSMDLFDIFPTMLRVK